MARPQMSSKLRSALKSRRVGKVGIAKPATVRKLVSVHRKEGRPGVPPRGSSQQTQERYYKIYKAKKQAAADAKANIKNTKAKTKQGNRTIADALSEKKVSVKDVVKYSTMRKVNNTERKILSRLVAKGKGKSRQANMLANKIVNRQRKMSAFEAQAGIKRDSFIANNIYKGETGVKGSKVLSYKAPAPSGRIKIKTSKHAGDNAGSTWDNPSNNNRGAENETEISELFAEMRGKDNIGYEFFHSKGGPGTGKRGFYKPSAKKRAELDADRRFLLKYGKRD